MPTPSPPLRRKFLFGVLATFALIELVVFASIFLYQRRALLAESNARLESALDAAVEAFHRSDDQGVAPERGLFLPLPSDDLAARRLLWKAEGPFSPGIEESEQIDRVVGAAPDVRGLASIEGKASGEPMRIAWRVVETDSGRHLIAAASSLEGVLARSRTMLMLLAIAFPLSLIPMLAASWRITETTRRTIQRLDRFATRLEPDTLRDAPDLEPVTKEVAELEEHLESGLRRLAEGYERQYHFLADVSHELKNPISAIASEAQLMAERPDLGEPARRFARSVAQETVRLARLIDSMLLLARVHEGHREIQPELVTVNEIVVDAIADCSRYAEQLGVRIRVQLDQERPDAMIRGEESMLRAAVDNLIRNAARFSPRGEPIDVSARIEAGRALVTVRDRGPGVPDEFKRELFERFRSNDYGKPSRKDTGLGLAIAADTARLHHGEITLEDAPGGGAVFTLSIPLAEPGGHAGQ